MQQFVNKILICKLVCLNKYGNSIGNKLHIVTQKKKTKNHVCFTLLIYNPNKYYEQPNIDNPLDEL